MAKPKLEALPFNDAIKAFRAKGLCRAASTPALTTMSARRG